MEPVESDIAGRGLDAATIRERYKPRLAARTQLIVAGLLWYSVALVLGTRGLGWLVSDRWAIALGVVGVALGVLKGRFIMERVARRATERIRARDRDKCAGGLFSWQSWLVVLGMIAIGHALRLTAAPRPLLGVLYVAIATGLLLAGRLYWRSAADASRDG
jgi:hypothetical protein